MGRLNQSSASPQRVPGTSGQDVSFICTNWVTRYPPLSGESEARPATVVFFITALITAVERTMVSQTLDVLPHLVVRRSDETARALPVASSHDGVTFDQVHEPAQRLRSIEAWQTVVSDLEETPGVQAVSPTASGRAMAWRGRGTRAVTLLGAAYFFERLE